MSSTWKSWSFGAKEKMVLSVGVLTYFVRIVGFPWLPDSCKTKDFLFLVKQDQLRSNLRSIHSPSRVSAGSLSLHGSPDWPGSQCVTRSS